MTGPIDANLKKYIDEAISDAFFDVDKVRMRFELKWLQRRIVELHWLLINERYLAAASRYRLEHGYDDVMEKSMEIMNRHNAWFEGAYGHADDPVEMYNAWVERIKRDSNVLIFDLDVPVFEFDFLEPLPCVSDG